MISTGKPLFLNTNTGSIEQYTSEVNMDLSGVTLTTLNVSGISTIGGATVNSGAISGSSFSGSSLNVSGVSTVSGVSVNSGRISGVSSVTSSTGEYLTVPPGTIIGVTSSVAPAGYLKANGATISRTTYSVLFNTIGTTYGAGVGGTTFGIPDLRGEFLRGWDDGRGIDSGRAFGTAQTDAFQNITGSIYGTYAAIYRYGATGAFSGSIGALGNTLTSPQYTVSASADYLDFNAANSPSARTATETRPRNIALLYCIKY